MNCFFLNFVIIYFPYDPQVNLLYFIYIYIITFVIADSYMWCKEWNWKPSVGDVHWCVRETWRTEPSDSCLWSSLAHIFVLYHGSNISYLKISPILLVLFYFENSSCMYNLPIFKWFIVFIINFCTAIDNFLHCHYRVS